MPKLSKRLTPDSVCATYAGKIKMTIRLAEDNEDIILIEGEREALEFLGKLLLAQATAPEDCGVQLGPNGAGKAFFSKQSTKGIYIHRLPCRQDHQAE